jgi:hypothetical protein
MERLSQDQLALDRLIDGLLDRKEQHVRRHRGKLEREAQADVERAHERYDAAVREVERARDELLETRRTRRWAMVFPEAGATQDDLLSVNVAGGLLAPVKRTLGTSSQVPFHSLTEALRVDAEVLRDYGTKDASREGLDVRRDAIWMDSPEGQETLREEKQRQREEFREQQMAPQTGWEE